MTEDKERTSQRQPNPLSPTRFADHLSIIAHLYGATFITAHSIYYLDTPVAFSGWKCRLFSADTRARARSCVSAGAVYAPVEGAVCTLL